MSKTKHNYTNELELKSLLIRIKNSRKNSIFQDNNKIINKYIKKFILLTNHKYNDQEQTRKKKLLKLKIKDKIIELSELSGIDYDSYERFGQIILLMIKNILTKPQFSGYTYKDEFYSDAVHKILRYLDNFDHNKISIRTNNKVNAFAYISQIIHNSILYIINTKKKESIRLKKQVQMERLNHNYQLNVLDIWAEDESVYEPEIDKIVEIIHLDRIEESLVQEMQKLKDSIDVANRIDIYYPKDYKITFEEYDKLKLMLKSKINLMRSKK